MGPGLDVQGVDFQPPPVLGCGQKLAKNDSTKPKMTKKEGFEGF